MQITGGFLRSRSMYVPASIRASSNIVRKAIFDILGTKVQNAEVLDLYAGSGSLGFESLSRGAKKVLFVEKDKKVADAIRRNGKTLKLEEKIHIITNRVERVISKINEKFDIVFADPPYKLKIEKKLFLEILSLLKKNGVFVLEKKKTQKLQEFMKPYVMKETCYGESAVFFFTCNISG